LGPEPSAPLGAWKARLGVARDGGRRRRESGRERKKREPWREKEKRIG